MIEKMRIYDDYRPSGDKWIGHIPAHWRSTSLGAISKRKSKRNRPDLPLLSVLREKGIVLRSSLSQEENHNFIPDDLSNYQVASEGDLVVNKMKAWQGSVGIAPQDGIVSPAYYIFELAEIKKKYAHRLLRSRLYADFFGRASDGVRIGQWDLGIQAMKRIPIVIPPPEEQDAISRYLDEVDRRIARFIRNRRRLIEVLNEQKQAIINKAVTRGLDPNVPLKPSGIEWLGDIPKSWTLKRLKYVVSIRSGQVDPKVNPFRNWILIAPEHITKQTGEIRFIETAQEQGAISGKYRVEPGEVMYSKIRPALRKAAIAEEKCLCSADMYPLAPRQNEILPKYLLLLLLYGPVTRYLIDYSLRVAMPKVNREALGNCWLCYPDLETQRKITVTLDNELMPLNSSIDKAQREIDLIREYRTRLISDVVTGKVDVRHLAPAPGSEELEEKLDELEPLDETASELGEEALAGEVSNAD